MIIWRAKYCKLYIWVEYNRFPWLKRTHANWVLTRMIEECDERPKHALALKGSPTGVKQPPQVCRKKLQSKLLSGRNRHRPRRPGNWRRSAQDPGYDFFLLKIAKMNCSGSLSRKSFKKKKWRLRPKQSREWSLTAMNARDDAASTAKRPANVRNPNFTSTLMLSYLVTLFT